MHPSIYVCIVCCMYICASVGVQRSQPQQVHEDQRRGCTATHHAVPPPTSLCPNWATPHGLVCRTDVHARMLPATRASCAPIGRPSQIRLSARSRGAFSPLLMFPLSSALLLRDQCPAFQSATNRAIEVTALGFGAGTLAGTVSHSSPLGLMALPR